MRQVIVIFKPDGSIEIAATGYKGNFCEKATAFLKVLGQEQEHKHTAEFYLPPEVEVLRENVNGR